jgi:hyperosmotically inducible protein
VLVKASEAISGVQDVETSNLVVQGKNQPNADNYITAKVQGKFQQEKLVGNTDEPMLSVTVETKDGVVYLKGTTVSVDDGENAVAIAKLVHGVKSVKPEIEVTGGAAA